MGVATDIQAGFNRNLHGLRGMLAVGVLIGHTGIADVGSMSVWFFFVLSGYLLASIYADGMRPDQLPAYAIRRFFRLVPLYAAVLVAIAIVPDAFYESVLPPTAAAQFEAISSTFWQHLFFLKANLHFWTLAQEMVGYILIAALMLARRRLHLGLFLALCVGVALISELDFIPMRSDQAPRPFYATHFIIGVMAAMVPVRGAPKPWASALSLAILAAIFVAGMFANFLTQYWRVPYWHHVIPAQVWGLIGGVVILGLAHGTNVLDRLYFFGTISYGIYVFHYLAVMANAGRLSAVQALFCVSLFTFPMAWLSYRYIEAPCIAFAHRVTRRRRTEALAAGN